MINLIKNRNFWLVFWGDIFLIIFSYYFAHYIRFDGDIPLKEIINFQITVVWILPLKLICFYFFNLYKGMWRYTSIHDLINLIKACLISSVTIAMFLGITVRFQGFSRGVYFIDFILTFLLVGGYRISIRLFLSRKDSQFSFPFKRITDAGMKRLLLIGAGDSGEDLIREIRKNPNLKYDVVGLIDDDPSKLNQTIHGVPVLGTLNDMGQIVKMNKINELIIAIPSASTIEMRRMVNFCESTGAPYKTIPGMGELIEGKISVSAIRDVRYEDLLGRKQVELDMEQIGGYLSGKRVMVTGGGQDP